MRFFKGRGRGRNGDRNAKGKRQDQQATRKKDDESVGSDLPTVDQFEIAVPSKSFASAGGDDPLFPDDTREDEAMDERSNSDVSSITSVSYRAGYYYLRNAKKNTPEKSPMADKSASCCSAPSCSCSWLSCCCCAEAKSELATVQTSQNSVLLQKPRKSHPSPSARRAIILAQQQQLQQQQLRRPESGRRHSRGRGAVHPGFDYTDGRKRKSHSHRPSRRHSMTNPSSRDAAAVAHANYHLPNIHHHPMQVDPMKMIGPPPAPPLPGLNQNHSLFDELSEEEEIPHRYGHGRKRMMSNTIMPVQPEKNKSSGSKAWRIMRGGGPGYNRGGGRQQEFTRGREAVVPNIPNDGRDRAKSLSRSRKAGRRFGDRYQV